MITENSYQDNELFLLAEVASLYYEQNLTQEQIAKLTGVSRSNISRMLKESREREIVEIKVNHPLPTDNGLQNELKHRLGLQSALVLAKKTDNLAEIAYQVGILAGRYLLLQLKPASIIGAGWGQGVLATVERLKTGLDYGGEVVQLMGSLVSGMSPDMNGPEIVRQLAAAINANPYYLHAPLIVADISVRDSLVADRYLQRTLQKAKETELNLVSVGGVGDTSGVYRSGYITTEVLAGYRAAGAVAEVCGTYVRQDGTLCKFDINDRMISVAPEVLRNAPLRIGVSFGLHKSLPNIGAVRANLINVLITDELSARATLQILDDEDRGVYGK